MNINKNTLDTLKEIRHILKTKHNTVLSLEEIAEIANSQFIAANLAFKKGLDVRLVYIGTFVNRSTVKIGTKMKKLNENKSELSKFDYLTKHKEIVEERRKDNKTKSNKIKTIKEFSKFPDVVRIKNKFSKVLENDSKND